MNDHLKLKVIQKYIKGTSVRNISRSTDLKEEEIQAILKDKQFMIAMFGEEQGTELRHIIRRKSQNIKLAQSIIHYKNQPVYCNFDLDQATLKIRSGELWYDCPENLRNELKALCKQRPRSLTKEEFLEQFQHLRQLSEVEQRFSSSKKQIVKH